MHPHAVVYSRSALPGILRLGIYGRTYAGLAFNSATEKSVQGVQTLNAKPRPDITAGLENKAQDTGRINSENVEIAAGLDSASKWLRPQRNDPSFEVVGAGPGAVVVAKIPPSTHFYTTVNTAIAYSSEVESGLSTEGGALQAVSRKLGGGALFWQRFWTTDKPGHVIIAPKNLGDIAAVQMDGTAEYHVRQKAFVAASPGLTVASSPKGFGMGIDGMFNYRVKGKGALAIAAYGGLYRLVLAPGEEYLVDPRHIVAWDSSIDPRPANNSQAASQVAVKPNILQRMKGVVRIPNLTKRNVIGQSKEATLPITRTTSPAATQTALSGTEDVAQRVQELAKRAWKKTLDVTLSLSRLSWKKLKQWLVGDRGYYRLQGPGDFYISSRLQPSLMWLKEVPRKNTIEHTTLKTPYNGKTQENLQ